MQGRGRALRTWRPFVLLVLAAMIAVMAPVAAAQDASGLSGEPLPAGDVVHVPAAKDARLPAAAPVTREGLASVIIELDVEAVSTYDGGVPGHPPTNPRARGLPRLDLDLPEVARYRALVQDRLRGFERRLEASIPGAEVTAGLDLVLGGVAALVPAEAVDDIAALPEVRAVYEDRLVPLQTERSNHFIGSPTLWNTLGGQGSAGEGVVVGVLDTGIWPEHASFSDPDPLGKPYAPPPGGPYACQFGSAVPGDAPFTCNNKLVGAYRFMTTYDLFGPPLFPGEFLSARDDNGHGTHTSSTAAGNRGVDSSIFGIDRGVVSGVAPRAHVIAYKVCGDAGCFVSDSAAAVNQAIADGVDVLNFSIGGGTNPYADAVSLAFLGAYEAGVFVAASAGNSGPGQDTVSHRGPWMTTVGASTTDRHFLSTLTLAGDGGAALQLVGATVTEGISTPTPVVLPPAGQQLCLNPFPPGTFSGEIVVCERGIIARVEKSFNVAAGGAGGMILYNPVVQGLNTDNHFIPSVHLDGDEGVQLLEFLDANTGVTATFTQGTAETVQGDVMADFSSRGGPGQTLGVSKPDVTAPGVQILAGHSPMPATVVGGRPGERFQSIQGTSMSSPHVAGAAALLRHARPSWTPGQIKSALMTSAKVDGVVKEDGSTTFTPFDAGSGRIDLTRAADPGLTFDESALSYVALQHQLWNSNYPSLYVPAMPGVLTVQRRVRSVLGNAAAWQISVSSPSDLQITVPPALLVPPGAERTLDITIDASAVPLGEVRHARLRLRHGARQVTFPITIVRREQSVTLDKDCSPTTIPRGATTSCEITMTNEALTDAAVEMRDDLPARLRLVPGSVVGGTATGNSVLFSGTLAAAEPPDVAITAAAAPFGYFPLTSAPVAGVGDESLVNFTLPVAAAFEYGGELHTRVGMVSNGYLVVGGGTGADIQFINQHLPDPAPPNNVLAPFWTDLNPAAGGGLRAQILSAGANLWTVFEWRDVPNFGNVAQINTFQVWLPAASNTGSPALTEIHYAYGPVLSAGDGGFLTVGAENVFGNRGDMLYFDGAGTLPAPGSGAMVTSTGPLAGGTHVVTFDATGFTPGSWENCARMTSSVFTGTTVSCVLGAVTPLPPGP